MASLRSLVLMLLVVIDGAALVFAMLGGSSWEDAGRALFLIACFTPVKGITYRRLGGRKPYATALLSTFSWQAIGLPIDLESFWAIMGASLVVSFVVDFLALVAMDAAPTVARCVFLGLYGSLIVHFLTVGYFTFTVQRNVPLGLALLAVGVGSFLLPAFYTDLFTEPRRGP